MAKLNITYSGTSADLDRGIPDDLSDDEIRRIAVEVIRSGDLPGLHVAGLADNTLRHFVVDRFVQDGEVRVFLRPKVPFG